MEQKEKDWLAQMKINCLEKDILENKNITEWSRQMIEINEIKVKSCLLEQRIKILNKIMESYTVPSVGKRVLIINSGVLASADYIFGEVVPVEYAMAAFENYGNYIGPKISTAKFFVCSKIST